MDRVLGYIGYAVIIAFALGWMDTLHCSALRIAGATHGGP